MARELTDGYDFTNARVVYPWGRWTNGAAWEVTAGEDFNCTVDSFVSYLHRYARLKNMKVRTRTQNDSQPVRVVFRFNRLKPRGAVKFRKRKVCG